MFDILKTTVSFCDLLLVILSSIYAIKTGESNSIENYFKHHKNSSNIIIHYFCALPSFIFYRSFFGLLDQTGKQIYLAHACHIITYGYFLIRSTNKKISFFTMILMSISSYVSINLYKVKKNILFHASIMTFFLVILMGLIGHSIEGNSNYIFKDYNLIEFYVTAYYTVIHHLLSK